MNLELIDFKREIQYHQIGDSTHQVMIITAFERMEVDAER